MLELKVADYCHNCPYFEPVVEETALYSYDGNRAGNTYIVCENSKKCENIAVYLEKKLSEPISEDDYK